MREKQIGQIMQRFIAEQNIEHFKAALALETDKGRRETLLRLLSEEQVKLAEARLAEENEHLGRRG